MNRETMDSTECAELLRVSLELVEELSGAGELPALKVGGRWLFVRQDLLSFLAERGREEAAERRALHNPGCTPLASRPPRPAPQVAPATNILEVKPPPSKASHRDQVVEAYFHHGMKIEIYRDAGMQRRPTYFAVVINPMSKTQSGSTVDANSYVELKAAAEARAERKAAALRQKQASSALEPAVGE